MLPTNKFDINKDTVCFSYKSTGGCCNYDPYYGLAYSIEIWNSEGECIWVIYRNLEHDLVAEDRNNEDYYFSNWKELENWFKQ